MDIEKSKIVERNISDHLLISYLTLIGFKQYGFPTLVDTFVQFRYESTPELEDAIEKFYLRQTSVDALTILEEYRTVKAWAYEIKKIRRGGGVYGN